MIKKIVIVEPPIEDFYFTPHRFSGLGSSLVEKKCIEHGFSTERILFPLKNSKGTSIELPKQLNYLKPFLLSEPKGQVTFFKSWKRYGPDYDECAKLVLSKDPFLVCISSFAFSYAHCTLKFADSLKKIGFKGYIIVGGAGPSCFPEYYLRSNSIDFVFEGECELGFTEFLDSINNNEDFSKIPNLWIKSGVDLVRPYKRLYPKSDNIYPAIQILKFKNVITAVVSFTRGCPFSCSFCSQHMTFGNGFRYAPLENVLDQLIETISPYINYDIKINFEDDNLLMVQDVVNKLLIPLKERFPSISFLAENGLDYRLINEDLLETLIKCGFSQFNLSLGALKNDPQLRRKLEIEKYLLIQQKLLKNNIPLITYFISGLKSDSPEEICETLVFLMAVKTKIGISMFYPVPGISNFEDKTYFLDKPSFLSCGSVAYPHNKSLSTSQLITSFYLSRLLNVIDQQTNINENQVLLVNECFKKRDLLFYSKDINDFKSIQNLDNKMMEYFFSKIKRGD